jgi:hypothetical protein
LQPSRSTGRSRSSSIDDTLRPTSRSEESAQALIAPLDTQVEVLENEPGVRKNL